MAVASSASASLDILCASAQKVRTTTMQQASCRTFTRYTHAPLTSPSHLFPPMSSLTEAEDDDPDHKLPSAVEKLGHNYRGKSFKQLSKNSSFTLPSGVTMLSSIDSEALEGVDDPHVRAGHCDLVDGRY